MEKVPQSLFLNGTGLEVRASSSTCLPPPPALSPFPIVLKDRLPAHTLFTVSVGIGLVLGQSYPKTLTRTSLFSSGYLPNLDHRAMADGGWDPGILSSNSDSATN